MQQKELITFAAKALGIYVLWYIVYDLYLLPKGSLDLWLSLNIVEVSAGLLHSLGFDVWVVGRVMGIGYNAGIELVDGCNGIAAMGLFWGFVLAYPGDNVKRVYLLIAGMFVIYLVNVARIVTLAVVQDLAPDIMDFTHDYSTTAIFYIVIFIMWVIWANYGGADKPMRANA